MYKVCSGEATATMCVCVLQCIAACSSLLQCNVQSLQRRSHCNYVRVCVAVYCSVLQCVAACCNAMYKVYIGKATATMCICVLHLVLFQFAAVYCTKFTADKPLQLCACVCCSVLQCFAPCCIVLQCNIQSIQRISHCNYVHLCVAVYCIVLECNLQSLQWRSHCNYVRVCVAVFAVCCSLLQLVIVENTTYAAEKPLQLCACVCCSVL